MDRLYHTYGSAAREAGHMYQEKGEMDLLKKLIRGEILPNPNVICHLSGEQINNMLGAIEELSAQIKESKLNQLRNPIRMQIARKLLNIRAIVMLPVMPFLEDEHEFYMPAVTLESFDVQRKLEWIKTVLEQTIIFRAKNRASYA